MLYDKSYKINGVTILLLIGMPVLRVGGMQEIWKGEVRSCATISRVILLSIMALHDWCS